MTTLLIDADILVFKVANACQGSTDWGNGQFSTTADLNEAKSLFRTKVAELKGNCDADKVVLALKDEGNFRRRVLPTYKANRANLIPPMLRQPLMDWLLTHPQVVSRPLLEGDDVIGILATRFDAHRRGMPPLIWSTDKDLRQIPGRHLNSDFQIEEISEEQADHQFYMQCLTGDSTDNYKGCPGIGPVKAQRVLDSFDNKWDAVVSAYAARSLTEADALVQARVARILRATDYDFTRKAPILWTPTTS